MPLARQWSSWPGFTRASTSSGVSAKSPAEGLAYLDPDTAMCPDTLEAALRAAGANVLAVDLVMGRAVRRAFCNVRPPGHHAERDHAMGFCFFNNVAVGAAHAMDAHGLERIAILDFDVHLGNGTEDIFRDDDRVLLCSSYQYPLYPDMNPASVPGRIVNCPLPAGSGSEQFRAAVKQHWLPALEAFAPQMLFISAGFDAHAADPLAELKLSGEDYGWVTRASLRDRGSPCRGTHRFDAGRRIRPARARDQRRHPHREAARRMSGIRTTATSGSCATGP